MTAPWVVLVNYNGTDDTRKCLESLAVQTVPARVVVVDNASKDDPCDRLRAEFPWADVVQAGTNGGWAGGNNVGTRHALERGADLVILLNNDTVVPPHFVERMATAAERFPEYGIFGPVIRFMDPPHDIQTMGVVFNQPSRPGFFHVVNIEPDGPPAMTDVDIVNGCCLAVRRAVVEQIGYVDERFFLIHEESDWCLRAQRAGFKLGVLNDGLVRHKGSSSFKREGKGFQRYYDARNLVRLLWKHRRRPGRSPGRSLVAYLKYVWYRYCHEREAGFRESADAILCGVYDGFAGRYGVRRDGWRPGLGVLRLLAGGVWRLKGGRGA